jgi:hypothetical protein
VNQPPVGQPNPRHPEAPNSKAPTHPTERAPAFGLLQAAIVLLALATAAIHIYLAWVVIPQVNGSGNPDVVFTLNGLGYLALVGALYLPIGFLRERRSLLRWLLIGYTALTFFLWLFMAFLSGDRTTIGYITKAIELALIVLLILESRRPALP